MSSTPPPPAPYQRTASGYVSQPRDPRDRRKRLRLVEPTRFALLERRDVLRDVRRRYRLGMLSDADYSKEVRALERREPVHVRALWERHVTQSNAEHQRKLRSVWKRQLAAHFDGELACDLLAEKMQRWERDLLADGYSSKTILDAYWLLTAALRDGIPDELEALPWIVRGGKLWKPKKHGDGRELVERPACRTVEELEHLVAVALAHDKAAWARGRFSDWAHRIAIVALLELRNGEASGLGWDDCTLGSPSSTDVPRVRLRHQALDQWPTYHPDWTRPISPLKGRRARTIALHPFALVALLAQKDLLQRWEYFRPDGPVFPQSRSGTWRPNANCLRPEDFKELARAADLPDPDAWVPHSLRHSGITLESEAGASLKSIQARSGHASLRVLEEYIHARTGRALVPSPIRMLHVEGFQEETKEGDSDDHEDD